ncbi:hypothetical protein C8R45DRAFT_602964 [Mycena sanguinolenta]|nr:hypothetical protein C8R45DRAFT_602964 [Mycena sanguinolenta]
MSAPQLSSRDFAQGISFQMLMLTAERIIRCARNHEGFFCRSMKPWPFSQTSLTSKKQTLYIARSVRHVARNQQRYHASSEHDGLTMVFSAQRQADILSTGLSNSRFPLIEAGTNQWKSGTRKRVCCRGIRESRIPFANRDSDIEFLAGAGKTVLAYNPFSNREPCAKYETVRR